MNAAQEPAAQLAKEHPHDKALYIITRADLSAGAQTAQVAHAMADFCLQNPQLARKWHLVSEYLICLEAKDEAHLNELVTEAHARGLQYTCYEEPDYGDAVTAIALHPSAAARKFASNLPCAGRKQRVQEVLFQMARDTEDLCPYIELDGGNPSIEWDLAWGGGHFVFSERKYGGYTFTREGDSNSTEKIATEYFDGRTADLPEQWPAILASLQRAQARWQEARDEAARTKLNADADAAAALEVAR